MAEMLHTDTFAGSCQNVNFTKILECFKIQKKNLLEKKYFFFTIGELVSKNILIKIM